MHGSGVPALPGYSREIQLNLTAAGDPARPLRENQLDRARGEYQLYLSGNAITMCTNDLREHIHKAPNTATQAMAMEALQVAHEVNNTKSKTERK